MQVLDGDWQKQAEAKVAATLSKIPNEWRLDHSVIEDAKKHRQLAGDFIFQLLDHDTVECVSHDSGELVDLIKKKVYTSVQVAQAFCKTAAVAHQIVGAVTSCILATYFVSFSNIY
jgi:amidase